MGYGNNFNMLKAVTVFPEPLISIVASDDTICLNESSILLVSSIPAV